MPVRTGSTIAHYRLGEKIGAGGMGEVWRATDTRLGREVALKVLPAAFAQDAERMARFEREARLLASVNHPGIATVHGLERDGETVALAMELVPGEDLAQRLKRGPIPLAEALPIAVEVAAALDYAHERGIIHRDLKPANVRLTPEGRAKVLDFGLAKALAGDARASGSGAASPSLSPTLTAAATMAGMILGTAAYMSPEQAKGKPVDRRADLWAFGCILYEMLSGRSTFGGETISETLASVLKDVPDFGALPPETPAAVRRVLRRCLERDPERRLRSAADAALDLRLGDDPADAVSPGAQAEGARNLFRRGPAALIPWAAVAVLAAVLVVVMARALSEPSAPRPRLVELARPSGHMLGDIVPPAISQDGRWVVFASSSGLEPAKLRLRSLESFEAEAVPGTENSVFPFWSPDSRHVAYFQGGALRRFDVATRNSQVICACAPWGRGGSWGEDGTILFAPHANASIMAIPASGGEPQAVTELDAAIPDVSHRFPVALPGGQQFLFTLWSNSPEALSRQGGLFVASRAGGAPRRLLAGAGQAVFAPPATLLVERGGQLVAYPFDTTTQTIGTEATTVAAGVRFGSSAGELYASASAMGDLLFAAGENLQEIPKDLVWLDRRGAAQPAMERPLAIRSLELSPDGRRFVAAVSPSQTGSDDLWVGEFARGTVVRLTGGLNDSYAPTWSADGVWIAYSNRDSGNEDIYRIRADGTGVPERLFDGGELDTDVTDWSRDGRFLLFDGSAKTGTSEPEVWRLDLDTRQATNVLRSDRAAIGFARISPDGRWLAYVSNESGQSEVYVQSFPSLDRKWQVSRQGGEAPRWRADGRELIYVAANVRVFAVPLAPQGAELNPGMPELLFTAARALAVLAPTADHTRFLTATVPAGRTEPPLRLVLDWAPEGLAVGAGR